MGKHIKILIADDHTLFREGLRKLLEVYEEIQVVGEARDGKEAITKVDKLLPDVVLMDIKMPRLDGIESIKLIKKSHPEIKVAILSMYEDAEYVLKTVDAGGDGYMQKNTSIDKLVETIREVSEGGKPLVHLAVNSSVLQRAFPDKGRERALTEREREVLKLMADGNANKQIAERLSISEQTVKGYVRNILQKLNASDRTQAVAIVLREGLLK